MEFSVQLEQGFDKTVDGVDTGLLRHRDSELACGVRGHWTDGRHLYTSENVNARGGDEVLHGGGTGEGDAVWLARERVSDSRCEVGGRDSPVRFHDVDSRAALGKLHRHDVARDGGARQQDALTFQRVRGER